MLFLKYLPFVCITILPAFSQAQIYLGYQFSVGSKGGFTLAVDLNEQQTLETTLKKKTGTLLTSIFLKQRLQDRQDYYALAGYSFFINLDRFRLDTGFQVHGLNIGIGKRIESSKATWRFPIEAGFGPAYHTAKNKVSIHGFAGFSTLYAVKQ